MQIKRRKKECESQTDISCKIIIELGYVDFLNNKDERYRFKMNMLH